MFYYTIVAIASPFSLLHIFAREKLEGISSMVFSHFPDVLLAIGSIIFVDLILSGDNALIIGSVAARVPQGRSRRTAFIIGGLGAIVIRILFTTFAAFLLAIPYLQAVGGILVLIIAVRLLIEDQGSPESDNSAESSSISVIIPDRELPALSRLLFRWIGQEQGQKNALKNWNLVVAIVTITIADLSMSLDNIVAIGAIAHNHTAILVIGLFLSIALLLLGSALVSSVINRVPEIITIASVILAWVSSDLIWNDAYNKPLINNNLAYHVGLYAVSIVLVLLVALVTRFTRVRSCLRAVSEARNKGHKMTSKRIS